jgi:hypothetical protein
VRNAYLSRSEVNGSADCDTALAQLHAALLECGTSRWRARLSPLKKVSNIARRGVSRVSQILSS